MGRRPPRVESTRTRPRLQPLTPPTVRPPTMYRWKKKYTTDTGSANRIANAANVGPRRAGVLADHPVQRHRERPALARIVEEDRDRSRTRSSRRGSRRTPSPRATGVASGSTIRRNVWNAPAAVDGGRLLQLLRNRVEVALHVPDRERQRAGRRRPASTPSSDCRRLNGPSTAIWTLLSRMNSGAIVATAGSIRTARMRSSGTRGRGSCIRENA